MGLFSWIAKTFAPSKLTAGTPVVHGKPLWDQFSRLGGGLTPADISNIIRQADTGQPASFVDLTHELRQKDCQFQTVCSTRERAVALVDLEFVEPKDATADEKAATDLCRRIRDDFQNWPTLIEHLTGSFNFGHATAETPWQKTNDGLLLPYRAQPIQARDFIFSTKDGGLRYRTNVFDTTGVDLLAENPGRIVQILRRITGDVPAREGIARVIDWAALLRNWDLRDWVALGEIGWKPWRLGKFKSGAHQKDIDDLVKALESIGSTGIGAFPEDTGATIEWPKGTNGSGTSVHRELFDTLGREMAKAVIGTTTTLEPGPNGDRAGVETRDQVRTDIRESDARAVAACLRYQLFAPAVAVNIGPNVRVPVPWFQTEESANQQEFSEAVRNLVDAGLRISAKWVRDEIGCPEPLEGEEVLEPPKAVSVQVPGAPDPADGDGGNDDDDDDDDDDDEEPEDADKSDRAKAAAEPLPDGGSRDGATYTDDLTEDMRAKGARALAPSLAAVLTEISQAEGYEDALRRVEARYGEIATPSELKRLVEADLILAHLAGAAAVRQDTPELDGES